MSLPPDDAPQPPAEHVPEWAKYEAVGQTPVWSQSWASSAHPPEQPWAAEDVVPTSAYRRRPTLLLILVTAVCVVTLGHSLVQYRAPVHEPDYSGVVLRRSSSELPPSVVTTLRNPTPGFEESGVPLGAPPVLATTSTSYTFQKVEPTSTGATVPVTWSPCRPIHFVVNPTGAPRDFVDRVVAGVGAVSIATGLVFVNDGITDEPMTFDRAPYQPTMYGDRWAPVIIGSADATAIATLEGTVAGEAATWTAHERGTGTTRFITGVVVLDKSVFRYPDRAGAPEYVPVLRHELGHLVGLGHVDDATQLMSPTIGEPQTFQSGDLAGLAKLGQGTCAPGL